MLGQGRRSSAETLEDRSVDIYSVAFSPDDNRLATASGIATSFGFGDLPPVPGDITLWDLATQQVVHHFKGHTAKGCSVAFSPDGKRLASASGGWGEPGEIKVWSLATGRELELGLEGSRGITWPVAFGPKGRYLAWARLDYLADVKDRISANEALKNGRVNSVVVLWDLNRADVAFELVGHKDSVINIAFHPDGTQLATCSADKTIKIWDLDTGMPIRTLTGHSERVHGVAYSPDGKRLVSCGNDATAKIWDLETGRELLTFREHGSFVWAVAFSPDGEHIASSGGDGTIKVWDGTRNTSSGH